MASRLEALIRCRAGERSGKKQLLGEVPIDYEQKAQENMLGTPACFRPAWESEDINIAYKEFFLNLEAAISDDARSFQLLNARSIAKELIRRLS